MHTSCTVCAARQITFSLRCKKQRRQQLAKQLHRLHHLLHSGKQDKTHIIGIGLRCRQHFFSACTTLTLYFVLNKPAHHVHNKVFALPSLHFLLLPVVRCICSPPPRERGKSSQIFQFRLPYIISAFVSRHFILYMVYGRHEHKHT